MYVTGVGSSFIHPVTMDCTESCRSRDTVRCTPGMGRPSPEISPAEDETRNEGKVPQTSNMLNIQIYYSYNPLKTFSSPMLQMKKLSEMFIKLPRAARLVKDEVGVRPGLFKCKCHAGHVG